MPAKRAILLESDAGRRRIVFWVDVPASVRPIFRNPGAISAYVGATPAENQAIADGVVAEKVDYVEMQGSVAEQQAKAETIWTDLQADINDIGRYSTYGSTWNGTSWGAGAVTNILLKGDTRGEGAPTFYALTPSSAFAANKFHMVLGVLAAAPPGLALKLRRLIIIPQSATVTGVAPGDWTLQRRVGFTTAPAGGFIVSTAADSLDSLNSNVGVFNAPTTAPAGGVVQALLVAIPPADEVKPATLDSPTFASIMPFGGMTVYDSSRLQGCRPITIHQTETLELVQNATSGTGNCRVLAIFTVS